MRREGYELAVSRPQVVTREMDGEKQEPYELLTIDVEDEHQGAIMEEIGLRRGDLLDMVPDGHGRVRLEYRIPARGLIGFQGEFLTMTRGTGLMSHVFDDWGPVRPDMPGRRNGVLISAEDGAAVAYADQTEADHRQLLAALASGRLPSDPGTTGDVFRS